MRTRHALFVTLAATAVLATGCTGDADPGSAVRVGEDSVSLNKVDDLTRAYCEASEPQFKAQNQAFPMELLRWDVVAATINRQIGEQMAAEYDVSPTGTYGRRINELRAQDQALDPETRDLHIEVASADAYIEDIATQVAEIQLGEGQASPEALAATALDLRKQWTVDHPVSLDPRFGLDYADGRIVPNGDDNALSLPVGEAAEGSRLLNTLITSTSQEEGQAALQKVIEHARTLPADQRCG